MDGPARTRLRSPLRRAGVPAGGGTLAERSQGRARFALLAVLVGAELLLRGPARAVRDSQDLAVHFAAARVWWHGGDPYEPAQLAAAFRAGGGPEALTPTGAWMPSVYPAATYALEAPLALLGWRAAVTLAQAGSLLLVLAALSSLARAARIPRERAGPFVLAGLALAPLHTGLAMGQIAVPAAALLVLGWSARRSRPALSGVLIALGAALKPSLALPVVLAALARPKRRWAWPAAAVLLGLVVVGELRLAAAGHLGLSSWLWNVALAAGPGGMNSADPGNPARLTLLGWEVLLQQLPGGARPEAGAVAVALAVPLLWPAFRRLRAAGDAGDELYPLSLLCLVALLATYHRTYDAVLLWFPLAALARDWSALGRPARLLGAVVYAGFLAPGPVVLDLLARAGRVPGAIATSVAWRLLVLPYQIWLLTAAAAGLAWLLARAGAARAPAAAAPEPAGR